MTAAEVRPCDVTRYIGERLAADAATATINRDLAALKRMYKLALRSGELVRIPFIRSW
jgi:site-specific recombinase XerD